MNPAVLRLLAIIIAVAGMIDPAVTSTRVTKPEIAVIATDSVRDGALADRVARDLAGSFTVLRVPFAGAAGTVMVGSRLPAAGELAAPVFAVLPERDGAAVSLEAMAAPARTPLEARVPITATTRVTGASGRTLEVTLRAGGLIIDRVERDIGSNDETQEIPLTFVPTSTGTVALRISAQIAGERQPAAADLVIDVGEKRWAVLFFDRRPSWMSTFVRRAIERDPRFVVASRIVTSRNVSTDAGRPPESLNDLARLELFNAIVVGAPEALSEGDIDGLDAFMRRRGGGVLMLFDQRVGGAYERLTNVAQWASSSGSAALAVNANPADSSGLHADSSGLHADSSGLRASSIAWPARLPAGATPLALAASNRPVIWRSAVGAGQVIVSGALDAWKFRDPALSQFESYWQALLAEAADAMPAPIGIDIAQPMLAPGESTDVIVTLRAASLAGELDRRTVRASLSAAIEAGESHTALRLWPDRSIGRFRGIFRAPAEPGTYRVVVTSDGATAGAPLVVAAAVARATPDDRDLIAAWTASRGGQTLPASRLDELPDALARALQPTARPETWHPMRSAWWIMPFALLLAVEWWVRRRRGLA